ncbi:unnamed protein product [Litomosoides sigmodontis]|uniref:Uncharacterized protein n=1 Tax=Litomosoides sigmodontis TaxID=42156 RepID=A0A3P6SV35_LITSI|nr:unnamed protein product [Litomosoides sigmodontis]
MECDLDYVQPALRESDYAAVDPWEEDRKEAMKQLYSQKRLPDELEKEGNLGKSRVKFIPQESEIRRRERIRLATKEAGDDRTSLHEEPGNEEQATSTLNAQNSNVTIGQSLPSSPFAEIATHAAKSQWSPSQSPNKLGQVERSVPFTAAQRVSMTQPDDQVVSSGKQKVGSPAPAKLAWMPAGMTTWVSDETSSINVSGATPIIDMLNAITPESFVPQVNKIPTISSSTSARPIMPTTLTTEMPKREGKIPAEYQPNVVPIAKALVPAKAVEKTVGNTEFHNDDSQQFALPESNTIQRGLKTLKIHSTPANHNSGISLKKSEHLLGEYRQGVSSLDILPEYVIGSRYVPRLGLRTPAFTSKTFVVDQSRGKLQIKGDERSAAADKALDSLLKAMSSGDDIDQPRKKILSKANLKETEKAESLQKALRAIEETVGGNNKAEAYRKAMNLNLVPRGPSTSPIFPTTAPTVIDQSRIFLVAMNENTTSNWSEWTNWQRCFCGKQIRTRICHYETSFLVKGCRGKSYESRSCNERDHCSATTPLPTKISSISTTEESKFRRSPPHQPLSIATLQKSDDMKYFIA